MKKYLLLLVLLLQLQTAFPNTPNHSPDVYEGLYEQLLQKIYVPGRLVDDDSLVLEISFSIDDNFRVTAPQVKGGNRLLQKMLQQQLLDFQPDCSNGAVCGQHFVLPFSIRK